MSSYTTVVLAAGKGTRMRSSLPKVLHPIAGRPIIEHVLAAIGAIAPVAELVPDPPVIVLGHEAERVRRVLGEGYRYAIQHEQLGTGHAVRQALEMLPQLPHTILVVYGDTPLITAATLTALLQLHHEREAILAFVTAIAPDPTGYGRILRDASGQVLGIREEKHCDSHERAITEINAGFYCFDAVWLAKHLPQLHMYASGEYYLTDLVALAAQEGQRIATTTAPFAEAMGVNDRGQLAEADTILRQRLMTQHRPMGVAEQALLRLPKFPPQE